MKNKLEITVSGVNGSGGISFAALLHDALQFVGLDVDFVSSDVADRDDMEGILESVSWQDFSETSITIETNQLHKNS